MKISGSSLFQIKIIFILTTVLLIGISIFVFKQLKNLIIASEWINHTKEVTITLQKVSNSITEAEASQRGYFLSGDTFLLRKNDVALHTLISELNLLDTLVKDNVNQVNKLKILYVSVNRTLEVMKLMMNEYSAHKSSLRFNDLIKDGIAKMETVRREINKMTLSENQLMEERVKKYSQLSSITPIFVFILFLGSLIILLVSYLKINNGLVRSRELEKKLREEKILAENILNSSVDLITVYDKDTRILYYGKACEIYFGKKKSEVIGKKLTEVFPKVANTKSHKELLRAINGETIHNETFYSNEWDKYFENFIIPLVTTDGKSYGALAIAHDNTEIFKTKEKLRDLNNELMLQNENLEERNSFVETLINSSVDLIMVVDKDHRYISLNKKAEEVYANYYKESLIGKKITEIIPNVPTDSIDEAFSGKTILINKFKSLVSDNFYEVSFIPLRKKYEIYAVMMIVHDITLNILNEEEIRTLNQTYEYAEQIGMFGSYRYNFKTQVINYSDNLYRLLGCKPQEFPAGPENFLKFIHPDDVQLVLDATSDAFTKRNTSKWEYRVIRKDGKTINVRGTGKIIKEDNDTIWMIGTLQDITEEKNLERNLHIQNSDLEKMNKELQSFAYISSHDLQEPLRKIQTFSTRIVEKEFATLSENGKDHFRRMQNAAHRMQILIDDLLTYSRTNNTERKFEYTDLNKIVDEVKEDFKEDLQQKKATIAVHKLCYLNIIPFQFQQLLNNLVSNSLKFASPERNPYIEIKSEILTGLELKHEKLNPHEKYCHLIISDNGIGFESQYSEKIFELFQRLHEKDKFKGTGIGLAIVKKIVENHEGFITASGELGKGARFDIYIPV